MSPPAPQQVVNALAKLAGVKAPIVVGQAPAPVALVVTQLTQAAIKQRVTWQQIAEAQGHTNAKHAKRAHHVRMRQLKPLVMEASRLAGDQEAARQAAEQPSEATP